jgi:hypothetical protein
MTYHPASCARQRPDASSRLGDASHRFTAPSPIHRRPPIPDKHHRKSPQLTLREGRNWYALDSGHHLIWPILTPPPEMSISRMKKIDNKSGLCGMLPSSGGGTGGSALLVVSRSREENASCAHNNRDMPSQMPYRGEPPRLVPADHCQPPSAQIQSTPG